MAEENEPKEEGKETKKEEQPKRPSLKLIIIGVLVIILGAGGYLGWDLFIKENKNKEQISEETRPKEDKKEIEEATVTYPLDPFIVNLMDKPRSGKRYLKVTMILEIGRQEQTMILDRYKPQLTDTILILLSSKTFDEISTMEGKLELKRALLSRINQILGDVVASRIYFKEFVVQ